MEVLWWMGRFLPVTKGAVNNTLEHVLLDTGFKETGAKVKRAFPQWIDDIQ
jgi:hypothetical protein